MNVMRFAKVKCPGGDCVPTDMFKHATEPYCEAFAAYINNYLDGKFPKEYCSRLVGGKLIILQKPDGGVRPIVVQSAIYKQMAKVLAKRVTHELKDYIRPHQFAVESTGLITLAVQAMLQTHDNYTTISVDIENAYGSVQRDKLIAAAERSTSSWLKRYVWVTYSQPTVIVSRNGSVTTDTGVAQGDPMSMVLFALSIRDALKETARAFPTIQPLAYADDVTLTGDIDQLEPAFNKLKDELKKVGCRCNPAKSSVLERHMSKQRCAALAQAIQAKPLPVLKVLGVPIGSKVQLQNSSFDDFKKDLNTTSIAIESYAGTDAQGAMQLLLTCMQHKPSFIMETAAPSNSNIVVHDTDRILNKLLAQIAGVNFDSLSVQSRARFTARARLAIEDGGVGLRPWKDQRHVAYLATYIKAVQSTDAYANDVYKDIIAFATKPGSPAAQALEAFKNTDAFNCLTEEELQQLRIPSSVRELLGIEGDDVDLDDQHHDSSSSSTNETWRKKTAKKLFKSYALYFRRKYCKVVQGSEREAWRFTHLLENSLPAGGHWIKPDLSIPLLRLHSGQYAYALRQRLELPITTGASAHKKCYCGNLLSYSHLLNCREVGYFTPRHDCVKQRLVQLLRQDGKYQVFTELSVDNQSGDAMDIVCLDNNQEHDTSIDVTITSPKMATATQKDLSKWEADAFARKNARYKTRMEASDTWQTRFFTFLMTPRGGMSPKSLNLLHRMIGPGTHHSGMSKKKYAEAVLNVAVMRFTSEAALLAVKNGPHAKRAPWAQAYGPRAPLK